MLLAACVFTDEQMSFTQILKAGWLDGGYNAK